MISIDRKCLLALAPFVSNDSARRILTGVNVTIDAEKKSVTLAATDTHTLGVIHLDGESPSLLKKVVCEESTSFTIPIAQVAMLLRCSSYEPFVDVNYDNGNIQFALRTKKKGGLLVVSIPSLESTWMLTYLNYLCVIPKYPVESMVRLAMNSEYLSRVNTAINVLSPTIKKSNNKALLFWFDNQIEREGRHEGQYRGPVMMTSPYCREFLAVMMPMMSEESEYILPQWVEELGVAK